MNIREITMPAKAFASLLKLILNLKVKKIWTSLKYVVIFLKTINADLEFT
jgi:hypothetical protein